MQSNTSHTCINSLKIHGAASASILTTHTHLQRGTPCRAVWQLLSNLPTAADGHSCRCHTRLWPAAVSMDYPCSTPCWATADSSCKNQPHLCIRCLRPSSCCQFQGAWAYSAPNRGMFQPNATFLHQSLCTPRKPQGQVELLWRRSPTCLCSPACARTAHLQTPQYGPFHPTSLRTAHQSSTVV